MFRKILLPTDGSALSTIAVQKGLMLAKEARTDVLVLTVRSRFMFSRPMQIRFLKRKMNMNDARIHMAQASWPTSRCRRRTTASHAK